MFKRGGRTSASVRSRLSLERLDGRDLPSVTVGDPPATPPGSQAPPAVDPAYQAYLNAVDAAHAIFETAYDAAAQQYMDAATAAISVSNAEMQPLLTSYQAIVDQQQVAVNTANDAAYATYEAAWAAAAGDPVAQQAANDAYASTMLVAVAQANAIVDTALATIQPGLLAAVDRANVAMVTPATAYQSAVQAASQAYEIAEQAAWNTMLAADGADGDGGVQPMGTPRGGQPGSPIFNGHWKQRFRDRIDQVKDNWKPAEPKPSDPIRLWPPVFKVVGIKPEVIASWEGRFGGIWQIKGGGWYIGLPPIAGVYTPGLAYTGPGGGFTITIVGEGFITPGGGGFKPKIIVDKNR